MNEEGIGPVSPVSPTLTESRLMVRRLMPVECERLQGFPDNWTQIPYRGKPADKCPDSPRYKAIGNSWAVPCVRWIGKRIDEQLSGHISDVAADDNPQPKEKDHV